MDIQEGLKQLANESIDMVITSPPYSFLSEVWGLRDYGIEGQIGLEKHPQKYIDKLVKIFGVMKKKLKKTGSVYINLGDTYFGSWGNMSKEQEKDYPEGRPPQSFPIKEKWLRPKQLMGMPWRVAIALQDDAWILRNCIIWHKPNPMPSSVKDRLTNTYEFLFHFVRNRKYYYDLDEIREPTKYKNRKQLKQSNKQGVKSKYNIPKEQIGPAGAEGSFAKWKATQPRTTQPNGKNPGDLWSINPQPFKEAHFAVFPEALCEKPIKASCPAQVCKKCGKPRERIIETPKKGASHPERDKNRKLRLVRGGGTINPHAKYTGKTISWTDCNCGAGFTAGIVLDPFMGSGTVLVVTQKLRRNAIGIELKPEYCEMAKKRLESITGQAYLNGDVDKVEVIK